MRQRAKPLYWLEMITSKGLEQCLYNDIHTLIIKAEDNPDMIAFRISDWQYNLTQAEFGDFDNALKALEVQA